MDLGLAGQADGQQRRSRRGHDDGEDAPRHADHRCLQRDDGEHLGPRGAEAAQRAVVVGLGHDLTGDRLTREEKGHQGGQCTEEQQGDDLEMDTSLGTGRRSPNAVHVAGRGEDLTVPEGIGGGGERLPVGGTVTEADAHEIDVGNRLDGDAQSRGQTRQEGRRREEVLLALVRNVFVGEHGVDCVDVLRRPHNCGDPNGERGAVRCLVALLHPAREAAILELCGRVGIEAEAAADVEVPLLRRQLIDRDVVWVVGIGEAPGDHQRAVDAVQQVSVGRADRIEASVEVTPGIGRQEEVRRSEVCGDLWQINDALFQWGQRERVGRRAGDRRWGGCTPIEKAAVVGLAVGDELGHRRIGSPRAGERRQSDTAAEADHHGQDHECPPFDAQFGSSSQPDETHGSF